MFDIEIKGHDEIIKALRRATEEVKKEAKRVVGEQADKIRDDAKRRVSVDTGSLRDSIEAFMVSEGIGAIVGAGGNMKGDPYYADFVEFGTKGHKAGDKTHTGTRSKHLTDFRVMPAHPYLYPAARAHEAETWRRLEKVISDSLKKGVEG